MGIPKCFTFNGEINAVSAKIGYPSVFMLYKVHVAKVGSLFLYGVGAVLAEYIPDIVQMP